jgi:predicted small metal-binding protein
VNPFKEAVMAKELRCRDVGMDCDFQARGESEEDVLRQAATHASTVHNITDMPPELAAKVRSAIRTV